MDITFVMWATIALMAVAQITLDLAYRKLRNEHDRLSRVTLYALRDLEWKGIRETATGICGDASASAERDNVLPFRRD